MKKKHLLYVLLVVSYSYGSHANEVNCAKNSASINAFNNLILYDETMSNDPIKETRVQTRSKDDYLTSDSKASFDDCGTLLTLQGSEIKKSRINKRVLISNRDVNFKKADKGWDYEYSFKLTGIDEKGVESEFLQQLAKGKYLTDEEGRINKSVNTYSVDVGDEKITGKSAISYVINKDGNLSEAIQVGTHKTDNSTKKYFYDPNGRLIKAVTDSGTVEFFYDEAGRELSMRSINMLFTTEISETTCKEWNESGRCTKAEINASTLFKSENGQKNNVIKNQAEITFEYDY